MKFNVALIGTLFAAVALAAPAPAPAPVPEPVTDIEILRRHAEAVVSAAEIYQRSLEMRAETLGDIINSTLSSNGTLTPDDVHINIFCLKRKRAAAASALAAADAYTQYAKMLN
ncbi:hypothetical protein BP6252_02956 [Coleophoma cylindrospora]|uniref:Uncharacterized protein n=1 Tax=Coleophoma cylindrospora TaxID=1849047 RepID=A0A3D8S726_9HELO|nr:hypothetical protein BP6252_02956 [Coleophoma cylindrospora]